MGNDFIIRSMFSSLCFGVITTVMIINHMWLHKLVAVTAWKETEFPLLFNET